jgi:hypothetical protein
MKVFLALAGITKNVWFLGAGFKRERRERKWTKGKGLIRKRRFLPECQIPGEKHLQRKPATGAICAGCWFVDLSVFYQAARAKVCAHSGMAGLFRTGR